MRDELEAFSSAVRRKKQIEGKCMSTNTFGNSVNGRKVKTALLILLLSACPSARTFAQDYQEMRHVASSMVTSNVMFRCESLLSAAYPDVDKAWLRGFLEKSLYDIRYEAPVGSFGAMHFGIDQGNAPFILSGNAVLGGLCFLVKKLPPGASPPKPINKRPEDGQRIAVEVAARLLADAASITNLTVLHAGAWPRYEGVFVYQWRLVRKFSFAEIQVDLDAENGQIKRIMVTPAPEDYLGEPKVTREEALKMVEALPRVGKWFNPNLLSLGCQGSGVQRRLVWSYYPPPGSDGALPKRYAMWDAMNGEILLSDCMNGGTKEKPYHNPGFYAAPGKDQLEASIKKWAAEIEARNSPKDRHPLFLMTVTNVVPQSVVSPTNTASPPR